MQVVPDQGVVPFLMQNLVNQNDHFDWRLNLMGIGAAMPGLCGFPSGLLGRHYGGPTTVIAGQDSDYVTDHDGGAFRPMFTDLSVHIVENAGHWVHADQTAVFVDMVRRALNANSKSQRKQETPS